MPIPTTRLDKSRNALASALVDKALAKGPSLPSRTLARKLCRDNPQVFPSIESARSQVRIRRGANGDHMRNKSVSAPLPASPLTPSNPNPFELPKSEETVFEPYIISFDTETRCVVLSDIHIPYHNIEAITVAISDAKKRDVGMIILNGDTVDCYQISRFQKDPRKVKFAEEVKRTREFIATLRKLFPNARIVWKDGNHDERLSLYLAANAKDLLDLEFHVDWPSLLDFAGQRIEYVTDKRPIRLGKLNVIHGHEFPSGASAPVNPARGLFLRAKESSVQGHNHQTSEHSEPTISGKLVTCWSTGCLSELHPAYMPFNKWNLGYLNVDVAPNGDFQVTNKRIDGGVALN